MKALALAVTALVLACEGTLGPGEDLPARYTVLGGASGTGPEERTAECLVDLVVELSELTAGTSEFMQYTGRAGGHYARTVLDRNGDGQQFVPEVFYPEMVARFYRRDSVVLVMADSSQMQGRFWRALAMLTGSWTGERGQGTWLCAPLDITEGGWVDTVLTVRGTWHMERDPTTLPAAASPN